MSESSLTPHPTQFKLFRRRNIGRGRFFERVYGYSVRCHCPFSHLQTLFVLNHYTSARDEDVFAEASRFIPERWLRSEVDSGAGASSTTANEDLRQRHAFSCLPFGYGSRSCLGKFELPNHRVTESESVYSYVGRNSHNRYAPSLSEYVDTFRRFYYGRTFPGSRHKNIRRTYY